MTRRLQPCRRCGPPSTELNEGRFTFPRGLTRHDDRLCAPCRRGTPTPAEEAALLARYRARGA